MNKILPPNILNKMSPADRRPMGRAGWTTEECLLKQQIQNEGQLQKQIIGWLTIKGIFVIASRFGVKSKLRSGTPDICFCYSASDPDNIEDIITPVALEVKFGTNDLSEEQAKVKPLMQSNGWEYHTVRSLQEVVDLIRL